MLQNIFNDLLNFILMKKYFFLKDYVTLKTGNYAENAALLHNNKLHFKIFLNRKPFDLHCNGISQHYWF